MREITYTAAAREALAERMAVDPTIFVVGEGIGPRGGNFGTTLGLYEKYGQMRLADTPISERGFVGMCCGAASRGRSMSRLTSSMVRPALGWPLRPRAG